MKKIQETASVTYKEIICLAIKALDAEIAEFEGKSAEMGDTVQVVIARITKPLYEKRDVLKTLYRIESGVEYN